MHSRLLAHLRRLSCIPRSRFLSTSSIPNERRRQLFVQGSGAFGALGTGSTDDAPLFQPIAMPGGEGIIPKQAIAGYGHSALLSECGRLYLLGIPVEFRRVIRISSIRDISGPFAKVIAKGYQLFGGDLQLDATLMAEEVDKVSCSACLTAIIKPDGEVYCYGYNPWGQCGVDPEHMDSKIGRGEVLHFNKIPLPPCIQVDTGLQHCIALTAEGEVFTWGKGENGQLGNERGGFAHVPQKVNIPTNCVKVSAGFAHSAAISADGRIYIWGKGLSEEKLDAKDQAKLKVLRYKDRLYPREIQLPFGRKAVDLCSSYYSICVIADDNSVWTMGLGEYDRLPIDNFVQVENDVEGKSFYYVKPGAYRLAKGSKRVTILHPGAQEGEEASGAVDVVLHGNEAYTKPAGLDFASTGAQTGPKVSDIATLSSSINHRIAIVHV